MESPHVVVVDDNLFNLKTLRRILEPEYDVSMHVSGEGLIRYLAGHHADLILLDIEMPGESGFDIIKRLKANPDLCGIPVLFLTAMADRDREVLGLSLGAEDFISKLSAPECILARIRTHVALGRHKHHLEELVAAKTEMIEHLQDAILVSISDLIECRDEVTAGHAFRTIEYTGLLCRRLLQTGVCGDKLTPQIVQYILRAAPLHDIGKVGIRDAVLLKPGRLTPEEFETIKQHTVIGAKVVQRAVMEQGDRSFLKIAHDMILHHHERWDGKGYPDGLTGEAIPLSARIMAVADVYDALVTARPYKKPSTHEEARDIIRNEKGKHFDPVLVDAFMDVESDFQSIGKLISGGCGLC